jgi:hypothetical protein
MRERERERERERDVRAESDTLYRLRRRKLIATLVCLRTLVGLSQDTSQPSVLLTTCNAERIASGLGPGGGRAQPWLRFRTFQGGFSAKLRIHNPTKMPGSNPTTVSYNASDVKIYNTLRSLL